MSDYRWHLIKVYAGRLLSIQFIKLEFPRRNRHWFTHWVCKDDYSRARWKTHKKRNRTHMSKHNCKGQSWHWEGINCVRRKRRRGAEDKGVKQPHPCLPQEEVNESILNGMIQNSGIGMFLCKQYGGDSKKKKRVSGRQVSEEGKQGYYFSLWTLWYYDFWKLHAYCYRVKKNFLVLSSINS